jgi:hypothetical protein
MMMMRLVLPALLLLTQPGVSRLQGVVGLWSAYADAESEPAIVTDGSKWSGTTSPDAVTPLARALFGDASPALLSNAVSPNAFPLAVDRETRTFSDGELRVQFKLISGPTDQSAGIVLDLQPTGEYYFVRYNTKDGNLALWGFSGGDRRAITKGTGTKQLALGTWHELVVRVRARDITASIVGHPELDARFSLDSTVTGRVGLWAKRDVVTAFRRFTVTR